MHGKTPECFPLSRRPEARRFKGRSGFSLIEMLIVCLIMGAVAGIIGSLVNGYMKIYERAGDMSVAEARAQDVFNALEGAILDAGLGIPPANFNHYFDLGTLSPPIVSWGAPLSVVANSGNLNRGNAVRVVYSSPLNTKNDGTEVFAFSGQSSATGIEDATITLTSDISFDQGPGSIVPGRADTRSYITFSGMLMHPLLVDDSTSVPPRTLGLRGRRPHTNVPSEDVFVRNTIHPYQELRLLRAGVAYTDSNSVFHFLDVYDIDPPIGALPTLAVSDDAWPGFHVQGIRAVHFEQDSERGYFTANLLVEGDSADSTRSDGEYVDRIVTEWSARGVAALDRSLHYETFTRTWRTRSLQID